VICTTFIGRRKIQKRKKGEENGTCRKSVKPTFLDLDAREEKKGEEKKNKR